MYYRQQCYKSQNSQWNIEIDIISTKVSRWNWKSWFSKIKQLTDYWGKDRHKSQKLDSTQHNNNLVEHVQLHRQKNKNKIETEWKWFSIVATYLKGQLLETWKSLFF